MFCVFPILFEGLILQNRTMNIFHNLALKNVYEKPFVMLRITHVFAPQTYLKPLCQPVLQAIHSDKSFYAAFLRFSPEKGGDPAAPSETATLVRLHPSHLLHLRRLLPYG